MILPGIVFNAEKFKSLRDNFMGFLQFYSEEGIFFKRDLVVTLCNHQECQFNDKFLINMIDPLNDTNPGRFKKTNKYSFFGKIRSAIYTLENSSLEDIAEQFVINPKNYMNH